MSRRVALVGSIVVIALGGVVALVASSARGAWWLKWGPGKGEQVENVPLGPDLLDRLAAGREHVEIILGGRMLAQITGCG